MARQGKTGRNTIRQHAGPEKDSRSCKQKDATQNNTTHIKLKQARDEPKQETDGGGKKRDEREKKHGT
jgi:hypothetical protein